jgi:glycosyltransferase involved in cell wall biosynthesis
VASPSDGPLRTDLERAGARVEIIRPVPLDDAGAYEEAIGSLADWSADRFDIVLATTLTSFPAVEMATRTGTPSAWRIGEIEPLATVVDWLGGNLDPEVELRARRAFARASVVLFNSGPARQRHRGEGATGNLAVLESGTDVAGAGAYVDATSRADCRRQFDVSDDGRLLVCAGTLWPVKGQALLGLALRHLAADHPELVVVLAGQGHGPYGDALSRLARHHDLGTQLRLLPFQADVRPLWRAADVAVCPSESESMPAAVLEAMAFGLPVLGCRVGAVPELVEPGATGWLCEPNDLGSMIDGLRQVATANPDDLVRMGEAGARRVAASHDRAEEHRQLDRVLTRVARGAPSDRLGVG